MRFFVRTNRNNYAYQTNFSSIRLKITTAQATKKIGAAPKDDTEKTNLNKVRCKKVYSSYSGEKTPPFAVNSVLYLTVIAFS